MPDTGYKFTQRTWRIVGMTSLVLAGVMSIHAVQSGFLGQTIRHVVYLMDNDAVRAPSSSGLAHFIYWSIFLLLILTTLYMAVIDLRYIRLQYIAGKRDAFGRTLGDTEFRKSIVPKEEDG
jgi:hypothetical protein